MQLRSDDPVAAYDFGAYLTNRWKCDQRTVDLFRAATRLAPRYYDAYWLEACALQRAKRYSESIDVARKLLSLNPNDAAAFGIIGGDYACLGQDDTALTALHKALSLSPCNPAVYVHLLNIYEKRKDYPNVARTCLDYLAGNPAGKDSNTYRDSLADAYENQQQWPLCERYSRAALSVNPNDSVAHDNLGTALAHEGQNKAARGMESRHRNWRSAGRGRGRPPGSGEVAVTQYVRYRSTIPTVRPAPSPSPGDPMASPISANRYPMDRIAFRRLITRAYAREATRPKVVQWKPHRHLAFPELPGIAPSSRHREVEHCQ